MNENFAATYLGGGGGEKYINYQINISRGRICGGSTGGSGQTVEASRDAIAGIVVCSYAWLVRELAKNSYNDLNCNARLDKFVPEVVYYRLDGVSVESTDMSNIINMLYMIAEEMGREIYGVEGVRMLYILAKRNARPLMSHIIKLYNDGLKLVKETLKEDVDLPIFLINEETCKTAERIIEAYCPKRLRQREKKEVQERRERLLVTTTAP